MRYLTAIGPIACVTGVTLLAGTIDISECRTSVSIPTNAVALIETTQGPKAALQFVWCEPRHATFQYRYRESATATIERGTSTGEGEVIRVRMTNGTWSPNLNSNKEVQLWVGRIRVQWSYGSVSNCFLHYSTNLAKIKILSSDALEKCL